MEKVRGVRELPIFPLPVVLFPGMPMPLHIFEERYRTMLSDIRAGDNLFGLSYFDPAASDKDMPPAGHIGSYPGEYGIGDMSGFSSAASSA